MNLRESYSISHEVSAVSFAFYSAEDIRRLSVKVINNPILLNSLNHPEKGGLYDPALGPLDRTTLCATCGLSAHSCPGHVGHIELAVPIYNPLLFGTMFLMLKSTCFYCHEFKMAKHRTHKYLSVLKLIHEGLFVDAMDLMSNTFVKVSKKKKKKAADEEAAVEEDDDMEEGNEDEYVQKIDEFVKDALSKKKRGEAKIGFEDKSCHIHDLKRKVISEFFKKMPFGKCDNCRGVSPTLRRDGNVKIFQMPLSAKNEAIMRATGMEEEILFNESVLNKDDDEEDNEGSPVKETSEDSKKKKLLLPIHVKKHLSMMWQKESELLDLMFGSFRPGKGVSKSQRTSDCNMFFFEVVPVPPTRFRPPSKLGDQIFENPQNVYLTNILKTNKRILDLKPSKEVDEMEASQHLDNIIKSWMQLQADVNTMIDSSQGPLQKGKAPPAGIKQTLEKKEGLFRKHMMGKRVNFAARSVISPDPYIETSEIGIPMIFAKRLTYPEPVNAYNVHELRQAVINGPDQYPGATHIQHEDGSLSALSNFSLQSRIALSNQLLTPQSNTDGIQINKRVLRHLKTGDVLLVNRQPTLHKPSMMAHVARVLPGEKTIRLHYANCNTYNADFDGDEMNLHFPQNEIARAEAYMIANTNNQYLVPTDGKPLRGLIQDHIVAGVVMTLRDTFFTREEYHQIIFGSLPDTIDIETLTPCIIKPKRLWSGKQVVSTVLKNLTRGLPQLNLIGKAKVPLEIWNTSSNSKEKCEESTVIFDQGDLLCGVIDKNAFGATAYGLIHAFYELYGPDVAGKALTCLGRLFTKYLQSIAFTCRIDDLILTDEANKTRSKILHEGRNAGQDASAAFVGFANTPENAKAIAEKLRNVVRVDKESAKLDNAMKKKTNELTSSILSQCLPHGLMIKFPHNNMSMMTQTGAKGSNVNMSQITCLLGQQELEGRRVPVMISGKTLPSFKPYDTSARAGGFIGCRFLTGISLQEFFFHCMAGREGLVDTAVKTSRAGYLQRCIVKHLEGLRVNYDNTVRDSDGSVIQFFYGEDSLDVTKLRYLDKFEFSARNYAALLRKYNPRAAFAITEQEKAPKYAQKVRKNPTKYDPVMSKYSPGRHLGSISEDFDKKLEAYIQKNPDKLICDDGEKNISGETLTARKFRSLMHLRYLNTLIDPGEVVGVLAAQSIGEPSTQMTLNTFHFAGFGAKNVTLGIPRLREIVMTASANIKTPFMEIPLRSTATKKEAIDVCQTLSLLTVSSLLDKVSVKQSLGPLNNMTRSRVYKISLKFTPVAVHVTQNRISQSEIQEVIETKFLKKLVSQILHRLKITKSRSDEIGVGTSVKNFKETESSKEAESDDEVEKEKEKEKEEVPEKEKQTKKNKKKQEDDDEEEEEEEEENSSDEEEGNYDENEKEESDEETEKSKEQEQEDEEDKENNEAEKNEAALKEKKKEIRINHLTHYHFDKKTNTCEFTLEFPVDVSKVLMVSEVEKAASVTIIREVKGIKRCFIEENEKEDDKSINLATEGVNIKGLWELDHVIDINRISSNDIRAILETYGVEAARSTIMREIAKVFDVYGISVDSRHLSLIADYMTFEGGYRAMNRMSFESNVSPFQKMSFETTVHFLRTACLTGDSDLLNSPSSRLVVGKPVKGGTGCFDIIQPLSSHE